MRIYVWLTILLVSHVCTSNPFNVLLITVDDLRPSIGAYGDENAVTPNIDKLANEGILFKNAFAQQALCAPSRNSFLTSRRPDTLHLYDFYSYWRNFAGNFTTLPQYFKSNSYYTKSIGKVFHPGDSSNFTDDYPLSWSEPAWHPKTEKYKNSPVCPTQRGRFTNLYCPVTISDQPGKTLPDIESTIEAIKFLKSWKKGDKSFFLAVGFHKPHVPFKFPKKFATLHPLTKITLPGLRNYPPGLPGIAWNPWNDIRWRDDIANLNISYPFGFFNDHWIRKIRQGYFASVSYVDSLIGQLLDTLKMTNLNTNTIVVLMGDHGWSLGEHGEWSKYSNFDVAVKVPLIFRIPGEVYFKNNAIKSNLKLRQPVELLDVFPTLVSLAGLPEIPKCPKHSAEIKLCTEGNNLWPLIKSQILDQDEVKLPEFEKYALSQYPRPGVSPSVSPNSDKPKLHNIKFMGYSVRTRRYRFTQWVPWDPQTFKADWQQVNETEFYDHYIDPNEDLNLHGRPGLEEVEAALGDLLRKSFWSW